MVKVKSSVKKHLKKIVSIPKTKTVVNSITKISLSRDQIEESIRLKAYELYLLRLGQNGCALSDWLSAERMVLQGS